ncbi:hypothetical protein KVV02_002733 [Mortierella alpina]|uniref:ATP-dependent DNA helicase n=1 Tax=Mortierella alpina TaxID=64518 RepID=A0A9P7ZW85_MORAP|nr:hypothetical protein KVV02_002733 [Mortierella alpina]
MPSVVTCSACLQEGHARSSSKACMLNRRRLETLPDEAARTAYIASVRANQLYIPLPATQAQQAPQDPQEHRPQEEHNPQDRPQQHNSQDDPQRPQLPPVLDLPGAEPRTHIPIARRPFQQSLVRGANIVGHRHTLGPMVSCPHCKARVWLQERSGGSKTQPVFSICCMKGQVKVPEIKASDRLLEMLSESTRAGKAFRDCIRKYNSALSFTSMGVNSDKDLANVREGVYTYRIQGAVVHEIGQLRPRDGEQRLFAQIYFYDHDDQATVRNGIFNNTLQEDRLKELQTLLEGSNRFCNLYKTIREREAEQGGPIEDIKILLKGAREANGRAQRQYDIPSANEVAVLMPDDGTATEPRDIVIQGKGGYLRRIFETHAVYDPLQYVLLHPRGEDGWTYNAHLMLKKDEVPPPYPPPQAPAFPAVQQDQEVAEEQHQEHAEMHMDAPAGDVEEDDIDDLDDLLDLDDMDIDHLDLGDLGDQDLDNLDVDDLDDLDDLGAENPDLASENEFDDLDLGALDEEARAQDQQPRDKFVTARAYYAYRLQVRPVSDTDARCYFWLFGRLSQQYVVDQYAKIEAGRLFYIKNNQKKLRVDLYKGIMDAINRDRGANETGRLVVLPSSFAGGPRYMNALYQDAMTIVRYYGKPDLFITFTCNPNWDEIKAQLMPGQVPADRPDLVSRVFQLKLKALLHDLINKGAKDCLGKVIAHTWVIEFQKRGLPHAHILLILDAASKIKTAEEIDLVVSAEIPNPTTHPLAYETVTKFKRLQVHLEDHQMIAYAADADLDVVAEVAKDSSLMAWFKLNQNDPQAREHTYPDIPKHYTWRDNRWNKRVKERAVITRMYFVHPKDRERFALRLLLTVVKGATNFEALRTVPDPNDNTREIVYDTFREAALARDLLDNDQEWINLFEEAIVDQMPSRLRHLFAGVLCYCSPSSPDQLWTRFANSLSEDYMQRLRRARQDLPVQDPPIEDDEAPVNDGDAAAQNHPQDMVRSRNAALSDIHSILTEMGSSLDLFQELFALFTGDDINQGLDDVQAPEPQPVDNQALFNEGQRAAYDRVLQAIHDEPVPKKLFFIDGPGGTGKSFLYNSLIARVLEEGREIIAVASSGIAALILHGALAESDASEKQFIKSIYPGLEADALPTHLMADRALLTCLNANVDRLNALATDMMPGQEVIYSAIDSIPDEDSPDAGQYSTEYLNTLSPSGLPPFQLKLKIGQPIMLLRNMNPAKGLCNGTRLIVRELGRRMIGAEIMVGVNSGYHVLIPRPVPSCKSCGRSGHSRSSHGSYPNKPKKIATTEAFLDEIPMEVTEEVPTKAKLTCKSCGRLGHSRSSHQSCPNNPKQIATQESAEGVIPMKSPIARRPFTEDLVSGPDVVDGRYFLGDLVQCPRCSAFVFSQERQGGSKAEPLYSICCQQGKVHLPDIIPDSRLAEIVKTDKGFLPKIRKYNSSMSFASMNAKYDQTLASARDGVYSLKLEGKVTHYIGSLLPTDTEEPKCAQIYIYDPENQAACRQERFEDLDTSTLRRIQAVLDEVNPLCTKYKSLREREQGGEDISDVRIILKTDDTRKQYNKPATSEVAVLLP